MANNAYLLSSLRKGPIIVGWIVAHASPEIYDTKVDPDRFSFREAVAHLTDWEPILHERMKQIKFNPGSTVPAYDEELRAVQMNYATIDPVEAVKKWQASREESIRFFEQDGSGFWDNT